MKSAQVAVPSTWVEVANVTETRCRSIYAKLQSLLDLEPQVSDAVAKALVYAVTLCPRANPSDLWHHIIYRRLQAVGFSDQRWKRVSGFALERALVEIYSPRLESHHVRARLLPHGEAEDLLRALGIPVRPSKLDVFLEGTASGAWTVFGALHVKSSIAERIQDDVPASTSLMERGLLSIALTMDVNSFPPPHGDGVNHGELGGRSFEVDKSRPKRAYIEEAGQFDALFSFNLRTPPSPDTTSSGKRIFTLSLAEPQPDEFVRFVANEWSRRQPRRR